MATKNNDSQSLREFKNFSQNLKKTSLGIRFGRQLFTDPDSLRPTTIVSVLRALGANIPREAQITADLAQMLVAGQAVARSYDEGKSLAEIAKPSAATVALGVKVLTDIGWIEDKDGSVATTIQLGAAIACLIGSSGLDWQSWVSLASMAYLNRAANGVEAQQIALKSIAGAVQTRLTQEQAAFGENFKLWQSGKIGLLGWIAKNALEAPIVSIQGIRDNEEIRKKFPFLDLDALPVVDKTWTAHAKVSDSFMGMGDFNGESRTETYSLKGLQYLTDPDEARRYVYFLLIEPHIYGYQYANEYFKDRAFSLESAAILYCLGANIGYLMPDLNFGKSLSDLRLSPSELGENVIQTSVDPLAPDPIGVFRDAAIRFNGQAVFSATKQSDYSKSRREILKADLSGDTDFLYQFSEVRERVKLFTQYPMIPDNFQMAIDRGGQVVQVREKWQGWRKIQGFVAALQYLELVKNDPYFFNWENEMLKRYDFMGNLPNFKAKVEQLSKLSLVRRINSQALGNVAYFLNTTPDKLVKKNALDTEGAARYALK